jgi:biotin carboxyl carrier protein
MAASADRYDEGIVKTYNVNIDGEEFLVGMDNGIVVSINGEACGPVSVEQTSRHQYSVLLDGIGVTIAASGASGRFEAFTEARLHQVQVTSERERFRKQLKTASSGPVRTEIRAPMPALVVKVEVKEGDSVHEGQGLVVLEAMKMENEIRSHADGKVKGIRVKAGEAVEKDALLILLE